MEYDTCEIHDNLCKMICMEDNCSEINRLACSECFCVGPIHKAHVCDYIINV